MREVSVPYQIPFHDVDSLNIVWHGHYYKYFELARTELYRSCNFDIADMKHLGFSFPVIESNCRYNKPLYYGQRITITACFREWTNYVLIAYSILDPVIGKRLAYGYTKQAVCDAQGLLLMEVPKEVDDVIVD
ncbi:MAG: acyl-CoA thioesterase [Candidatus Thiodiazotropha sp. (ex Lucinoma kastoroae)]|nr:acyl-CoA thioesterase [Candidatus Thiodiazotropha sp. (ex Rostrolucina anterorostrata)]MCU7849897.1 acyl-CoA thioesterase [Candidatus Thiodiazotropha sp. (ex Lucinoma kastoroae)]